ncbi:conjugative transposon protein TraJ [Chitinophaga horti]|uniref:Conjugative transposon protein TraJ n=1 Tax=Chitinophaga horti TaxID=2920382 RepID=A0ABY6J0I1_9BACT|nr:conjugative transposon protein TraJ [Chitinophaga horti]UYQ92152.1 conjugative transposon protein TraJ [Chitinophaga horti]
MRKIGVVCLMALMPAVAMAQGVADKIHSLHSVLDTILEKMVPLCEELVDVAKGVAAFGALFYIAYRVWRHYANAEPIDFYPLFRPFVLGFAVINFTLLLALLNGLLDPLVEGTAKMVGDSDKAVKVLLKQKEIAVMNSSAWQMYVGANKDGDKEKWLRYTKGIQDGEPTPGEGPFEFIGSEIKFAMAKASYNFRNTVKEWLSEILQVLFQAASLCINTIRIFQLVVLSIIGPIVFGLAVFDGFQNSLTAWLARYINVFLWLPVCNIFGAILGKIQEEMLRLDLDKIKASGDTVFSAQDTGYLVFMLIGIAGYFTVPSIASFIVNSGGGGGLLQKVTSMSSSAAGTAVSAGRGAMGRAGESLSNIADARQHFNEGLSGQASGKGTTGAVGRAIGNTGYMHDKLSGGTK